MNIGIFTDTYFPQVSGVSTSIKTLKEGLEAEGHNVYIFTTTDPHVAKKEIELDIFRFSSIPFISFSDRRIAVRGLFQAVKIAKKLDLDVVHTQTEFSMGMTGKHVAKKLKIPLIHTYHTMYENYLHYILNGRVLKPQHVKQMSKTFLKDFSGIIAPSYRVLETLNRYGIAGPYRVIPTGINLTRLSAKGSIDVRKKFSIKDNQKILLSLSRLSSEKGIDKLISALPDIISKNSNVICLIVGEGPQRTELEDQTKELGVENNVIFVGQVDNEDVGSFYQAADIFVSASDSESQGLTYIEALSAGTKVVAYESDYLKELLDDPSIGMVYHTEQEMVDEITNYLKKPEKFMNEEPRSAKLNEISEATFTSNVLDFYEDAVTNYTAPEKKLLFTRSKND